jgi:preprotein translocase subunit SecE
MIGKLFKFIAEVKSEMKKVAWPNRQELLGSTAVVLASTFALAVFIGVVDFVLSKVVNILLRM